jgi:hypothetical protein
MAGGENNVRHTPHYYPNTLASKITSHNFATNSKSKVGYPADTPIPLNPRQCVFFAHTFSTLLGAPGA